MSPLLVGIAVGFVCFAVSVPLIGWIVKSKERRVVAFGLALLFAVAMGVLIGRMLRHEIRDTPPPVEGTE